MRYMPTGYLIFFKKPAVLSFLEINILRKNKTGLGAGKFCCGDPDLMKCKKAVTCHVCQKSFSNGIPCF